ncbi:transcriptional regulator, XRE family [Alkaliphilus metalliredigens QYMF]|uniref:Transcriptional regulator, XRE family n=1 Tax=Alkaliphilus metalliredigens (strain QYMF) TaxID=293826 RepID=A6TQ07_ALKMQ|nr:helix-turn-helix transcriptional regulator [Alkaliphilus metalliredigens]ABR48275.1 transcriptional regulator, XRE family [Alkaliphilus metalliredigens QYMF]
MRNKLIFLRGKRTQCEVGKSIGISQKYMSALELGKRNPSIRIMRRFEEYFGVNMRELFSDLF